MEGRSKEEEIERLRSIYESVAKSYGLEIASDDTSNTLNGKLIGDISTELCRMNFSENHNVAAVIGGVGSQEAVKIITGQYVPIVNTYTFNGIAGVAGVFRG